MPLRFDNKLVVYVTVGDPSLDVSYDVAIAAIDAGANVIELGVAFSDPLADGPVIQRAAERALKRNVTLADVLSLAGRVRKARPQAGLIIFSYLNPIVRYGLERFAKDAQTAGVDGALLTDLIVEEADEYISIMRKHKLATVFLAAPTSPDARLKKIANASAGFLYAISRTGITGAQAQMSADAESLVKRIRRFTKLPIALGFGISTPEQFRAVGKYADAAVIGSAIVKLIEENHGHEADAVAGFICGLRSAAAHK